MSNIKEFALRLRIAILANKKKLNCYDIDHGQFLYEIAKEKIHESRIDPLIEAREMPNDEELIIISRKLNVPIDWLLCKTNNTPCWFESIGIPYKDTRDISPALFGERQYDFLIAEDEMIAIEEYKDELIEKYKKDN